MDAIGTLRTAAIVGLVTLAGCTRIVLVNPPSANAPSACADLTAELSRRLFEYNAKVVAIRAEKARTGFVCLDPNRAKQRIAELSVIVAVSDKMDAKGCYQHPIGDYNRNLVSRLIGDRAQCEALTAPKG